MVNRPAALSFRLGALLLPVALLGVLEVILIALDLPAPAEREETITFDGLQDRSRVVRPDPDLLFRFAPRCDFLGYYRTTGLGYRGDDDPRPREDLLLRVVTLGDSCTFGLGVPEDRTFSRLLEGKLRVALEGLGEVEVVSLGIPGYSSWQNRRQIEIGLEGLEPDVVVWFPTGYNDAGVNGGATDEERTEEAASWRAWLARRRVVRLVSRPPDVELERDRGLAALHPGAEPRVPPEHFVRHLEAGAAAAADLGARLVLVRPALSDVLLDADPTLALREERVAETASRLGLPLLDLRREFAPFDGVPLTSDGLHPNVEGNALISAGLFRILVRSEGLLPPGPRRTFLRAFLDACDHGLDVAWPALADRAGWPPALEAAPKAGLPLARAPAVAAWLEAFEAGADGDGARTLRLRAEQLDDRLVPAGLLRTLLWGREEPAPPDGASLLLARRLAAFGRSLGLRPVRIDLAYAEARRAAAAGDHALAEERYREALRLDPSATDVRVAYSRWLQARGRQSEADAQIGLLLESDPDSAPGREVAGLRALAAQRVDEAITHLERARALDPVAPWTLYGLGRAYLERGRPGEAEVALRTAWMLSGTSFPDVAELHAEAARAAGR